MKILLTLAMLAISFISCNQQTTVEKKIGTDKSAWIAQLPNWNSKIPQWCYAIKSKDGVVVGWRANKDIQKYYVSKSLDGKTEWKKLGDASKGFFLDNSNQSQNCFYRITSNASEKSAIIEFKHNDELNLVNEIANAVDSHGHWPGHSMQAGFLDENSSVDFVTLTPGSERPVDEWVSKHKNNLWHWPNSTKRAITWEGDILWKRHGWMSGSPHGTHMLVCNMDDDPVWEVVIAEGKDEKDGPSILRILNGTTGEPKKEFSDHPLLSYHNKDVNLLLANLDGSPVPRDIVYTKQNKMNMKLRELGDREDLDRTYRLHWQMNVRDSFTVKDVVWRTGEMPGWLAFNSNLELLWSISPMDEAPHSAKLGDLDGDGRDEIIVSGNTAAKYDGTQYKVLNGDSVFKYTDIGPGSRCWGQADGLVVADFRPDIPGLEIVIGSEENAAGLGMLDCNYNVVWFDSVYYMSNDPRPDGHEVYGRVFAGDILSEEPGLEVMVKRPTKKEWPGNKGVIYTASGKRLDIFPVSGEWFSPVRGGVGGPAILDWDGDKSNGDEIAVTVYNRETKKTRIEINSLAGGQAKILFTVKGNLMKVIDVIGDGREELIIQDGLNLKIYTNTEEPKAIIVSPWEDPFESRNEYINSSFHYGG